MRSLCPNHVLGIGILVFLASSSSQAGTVYVNPNGSEQYSTIQAAINNLPNPGPHTVIVRAGTYVEPITISNKNTKATSDAHRILITADPSAMRGSVLLNTGYSANEGRGGRGGCYSSFHCNEFVQVHHDPGFRHHRRKKIRRGTSKR